MLNSTQKGLIAEGCSTQVWVTLGLYVLGFMVLPALIGLAFPAAAVSMAGFVLSLVITIGGSILFSRWHFPRLFQKIDEAQDESQSYRFTE